MQDRKNRIFKGTHKHELSTTEVESSNYGEIERFFFIYFY